MGGGFAVVRASKVSRFVRSIEPSRIIEIGAGMTRGGLGEPTKRPNARFPEVPKSTFGEMRTLFICGI